MVRIVMKPIIRKWRANGSQIWTTVIAVELRKANLPDESYPAFMVIWVRESMQRSHKGKV